MDAHGGERDSPACGVNHARILRDVTRYSPWFNRCIGFAGCNGSKNYGQ